MGEGERELTHKYFVTMIGVKPENWAKNEAAYRQVLQELESRDKMFLGRVIPSKIPQYQMLIVIHSKDAKTAKKRGAWMLGKVPGLYCSCGHDIYAHRKGGGCTKCDCGGYKGAMYWVKKKESKN